MWYGCGKCLTDGEPMSTLIGRRVYWCSMGPGMLDRPGEIEWQPSRQCSGIVFDRIGVRDTVHLVIEEDNGALHSIPVEFTVTGMPPWWNEEPTETTDEITYNQVERWARSNPKAAQTLAVRLVLDGIIE